MKIKITYTTVFLFSLLLISSCNKYRFWNLKKLPEVSAPKVTSNTIQSFSLESAIIHEGHTNITRSGFVWSDINPSPTIQDNFMESNAAGGILSAQISWPVNTQFYVRAFVENSIGLVYSDPVTVNWPGNSANLPVVQTINPNQIDFFQCGINGLIQSDGGLSITEQGFCYSTFNQSPNLLNTVYIDNSGNPAYSSWLTALAENTTYYIRAYAKNLQGVAYGNVITLTTNNYLYPGEVGNYGGLIVYSKIDTLGGWNFLEAAPYDVNTNVSWGNPNVSIPSSCAIGTGKENTLSIVQQLGPANPAYAALAAYYFPSGLNGWSLPSRDELMKMRENLYINQLGNFTPEARYWSSSEDVNFPGNAWAVKMTTTAANTASYAKNNAYKVRPIRRY
jgi:hypothetical protein